MGRQIGARLDGLAYLDGTGPMIGHTESTNPETPMNRLLIALGALLVLVGVLWPWVRKVPWFHLPGDIVIDRPGLKVFVPIATMVIISGVMSVVAWLIRK